VVNVKLLMNFILEIGTDEFIFLKILFELIRILMKKSEINR